MTLPLDIILDLHQDGLRLHINTDAEEVRLTSPVCEQMSIPSRQVELLRDMLDVVALAIQLRRDYPAARSVA